MSLGDGENPGSEGRPAWKYATGFPSCGFDLLGWGEEERAKCVSCVYQYVSISVAEVQLGIWIL